jgi:hypothetical protein
MLYEIILVRLISRACWHEDLPCPIPNYEDQGETVPASERTDLRFNRKLSLGGPI